MRSIAPIAIVAGSFGIAAVAMGTFALRAAPARTPQISQEVALAPLPLLAPPRVIVTGDDSKDAVITLARADVQVQVYGPLAETTLTLTFRNDTSRNLEGELNFPLPEGATVSGYALDIAGKLREAVPVEKDAARVIFEKEVRKGVDPGLVEQTVGNNFKTRIYPLPAHGTRTCRIRYVSDLETDRAALVYRVPLRWNETVPVSSVRVDVATGNAAPNAPGAQPRLQFGDRAGLLGFTRQGDHFIAERTFENTRFDADLIVQFPDAARATLVACEPFTRASMSAPESFFVVRDIPDAANRTPTAPRSLTRLGVVWDASLSRDKADLAKERRVLEQIIRTARTETVDVVVLRNRPEAVRTIRVGGDPKPLLDFLKSVPCDGGTNLASLRLPSGEYGAWLVFTDGLDTLGDHLPPLPAARVPLYTVASDARANHAYLRLLSERTGGAYLNLNRLAEVEAGRAVTSPSYSLLSVDVTSGTVDNVFTPGARAARDGVVITGVLRSDQATLALNYGVAGQVRETHTVTVHRDSAPLADTGLVGRFWAQRKADQYSALPDQNREWLLGLGNDFGIVTARTSLLVLERLDQYVEHKVTPPRSEPDLHTAYFTQVKQGKLLEARAQTDKMPALLALWQDRVRWWETHFPKKLPSRKQQRQELSSGVADGLGASTNRTVMARGVAPAPGATAQDFRFSTNGAVRADGAAARPRSAAPALYAAEAPLGYSGGRGMAAGRASGGGFGRLGRTMAEAKKSVGVKDEESAATPAEIEIKPWSPDTPYLKTLKAMGPTGAYAAYLRARPQYDTSPAFYLDCAEYLLSAGRQEEGVRVLTSLLELQLEDPGLYRIVAQRLNALGPKVSGSRDMALVLFRKVASLRPEEPQSFRDLALCLADRADASVTTDPRASARDYAESLRLLHKVALRNWDRFEGIEEIALMEAGRISAHVKNLPASAGTVANPFDPRLLRNLPCDVRITMTWDTDATDMDLWVTEPTGEKCFYSYNRTPIGGRLSRDFTRGYGPEEYLLRHAPSGKYTIQTNFYGSTQQRLLMGGTTLQAWVVTNWGRPSETRQPLTLRLSRESGTVLVGTVTR